MGRPPCCRRVAGRPATPLFGPTAERVPEGQAIVLALDELEALRLADREGLYQEQAAVQMGVSRATFGRIIEVARRKVAEALVGGRFIQIEGGAAHPAAGPCGKCARCRKERSAGHRLDAEGGARREEEGAERATRSALDPGADPDAGRSPVAPRCCRPRRRCLKS